MVRKYRKSLKTKTCSKCGATHRDTNSAMLCDRCYVPPSRLGKCSVSVCGVACGAKTHSGGMCQNHYARFKKHGDPLIFSDRWGNAHREGEAEMCRNHSSSPAFAKGLCKKCYGRRHTPRDDCDMVFKLPVVDGRILPAGQLTSAGAVRKVAKIYRVSKDGKVRIKNLSNDIAERLTKRNLWRRRVRVLSGGGIHVPPLVCVENGCNRPLCKRSSHGRCPRHARIFSIENGLCRECIFCGAPVIARGMCGMHYQRANKGTPANKPRKVINRSGKCVVVGCGRKSRGAFCDAHKWRLKTWGDVRADIPVRNIKRRKYQ